MSHDTVVFIANNCTKIESLNISCEEIHSVGVLLTMFGLAGSFWVICCNCYPDDEHVEEAFESETSKIKKSFSEILDQNFRSINCVDCLSNLLHIICHLQTVEKLTKRHKSVQS